jgi:hypothetical protein
MSPEDLIHARILFQTKDGKEIYEANQPLELIDDILIENKTSPGFYLQVGTVFSLDMKGKFKITDIKTFVFSELQGDPQSKCWDYSVVYMVESI